MRLGLVASHRMFQVFTQVLQKGGGYEGSGRVVRVEV